MFYKGGRLYLFLHWEPVMLHLITVLPSTHQPNNPKQQLPGFGVKDLNRLRLDSKNLSDGFH